MKTFIKMALMTGIISTSLTTLAFDNKQQAGGLIGGVVGGIIGNQVGGGDGKIIATFLGVIGGSLIGSSIGKSLDEYDRMALQEAQRQALESQVGTVVPWDGADYGSRTGTRGQFEVTRRGHHRQYVQETCKSYRSEIRTLTKTEVRTGTTCRRSDGSWYEVNTNEVTFY